MIGIILSGMDGLPGWVPPTVAISLAFIALSLVAMGVLLLTVVRRLDRQAKELQRRLNPVMDAIDRLADTGEDLGDRLKEEVNQILRTTRYVRRGVVRGVHRVRGRLQDLDALYQVVSDEVQDTALDVAARLRTFRSGASFLKQIRRLLIRGRR